MLSLKFSEVANAFERIEATTKRLEMTSLLVDLIKETPKDEVSKVVYIIQGKLYPDYVGVELGLAEKLLIKAAAEVSSKPERLVEEDYKKTGDLGLTVEKLLRKKSQVTLVRRPLTVKIVYETFDKIAHATGSGSVETKIRLLTSLLNDATPLEGKFIARMAVGKLRLGVADMTVLDGLAVAYGGDKVRGNPSKEPTISRRTWDTLRMWSRTKASRVSGSSRSLSGVPLGRCSASACPRPRIF